MKENVYIVNLDIAPFVPYIYGTLRVYAEADPVVRAGYMFREPFFHLAQPAEIAERLEAPAVLGLSCYVWNFRKHMKVARLCKERHPDALVVAGGPHIPERVGGFFAKHPYVDMVVHGEGEIAFRSILVERLLEVPDWSKVPGISFVKDGRVTTTERAVLDVETLDRSPYLSGLLDDAIDFFRRKGIAFYAPWETNRGCPYSCSFCDWGSATMSKVRRFDLDRLLEEVDFFGRAKVPLVHINDANFGLLPRDVDIAARFAAARDTYGYPREMRLNFAKNSNDRVFQISKTWNDHGLLNTTTLSMQATNSEVLAAIDRKNIPRQQYRQLQERYTEAGIDTYTEVILGLPEETRESFKSGLDYVLEMGNHDDVRIYELAILPNAPIAAPLVRDRYRLGTIDKELLPRLPGAAPRPDDEVETIPTVIETSTMSRADWIDCSVYARMLQTLHACFYTRYLAIHLNSAYDVRYHRFYGALQEHFLDRGSSVLGGVLGAFRDYYERYQRSAELPALDPSAGPAAALRFLQHRRWIGPADWAWLCLAVEQDAFYQDLREFLPSLGQPLGPEVDDLLRYQQDLMLRPEYDERIGKHRRYAYDFPAYFHDQGPLVARPTEIHYRDTHLGPRSMPLGKGDPAKFVNAALPGDWSATRGHYRHQLQAARIMAST